MELRTSYNAGWDELAAGFDNDTVAGLGGMRANPTRFNSFKWCGSRHCCQRNLLAGIKGKWRQDGEICLVLDTARKDGRDLPKSTEKTRVGEQEETTTIPADTKNIAFELEIPADSTELQTSFSDDQGLSRGTCDAAVLRLNEQ